MSLSDNNFAMPVKQRQTSSMFMAELRKELKELLENLALSLGLAQHNISLVVCQTSGSSSLTSPLRILTIAIINLEIKYSVGVLLFKL